MRECKSGKNNDDLVHSVPAGVEGPVLGVVKDRSVVLFPTWQDGPRGRLSVMGTELQMDGTVVLLHRIRFLCCRCCLCPLAVEQ